MGKLLMENFNRSVKPVLDKELRDNIVCALVKSPHKPIIEDMTGYSVLTELSLIAEEELASQLLRFVMLKEKKQRYGSPN